MAEGKRVVLVKPGDVLLICGVTLPTDEAGSDVGHVVAEFFRDHCGIHVALFEDDITIDTASAADVEKMVTRA